MKKVLISILCIVCIALLLFNNNEKIGGAVDSVVGSNFSTSYSVVSSFSYSSDKGHSYGDGTKEYSVGETSYMKVQFKVASNKKKTSQVKVVLSIPKIQSVDAKYMDGQVITPNFDVANNVTTYEFTANASKTAIEQECVIKFVPNAIGSVTMTLVYDDKIDSSYDIRSTLDFVEKNPETDYKEE